MTSTLVDSNVLIDIFQPKSEWFAWSSRQLARARMDGDVVINQVIASEVAAEFVTIAKLETALLASLWRREDLPWTAAYRAGWAHRDYRRQGGGCGRTLPDFLIGAHAIVMGYNLLTRDARRYRAYFEGLDIIAPDTHP
jgi:predicted nucleic acid-binding protein